MTTPEPHPRTVTIAYWAEFRATDGTESTDRIAWDEWAAMTERERRAVIDSYAEALASCSGGYGGEVRGDEPPPAPEPPAMPGLVALAEEARQERLRYVQREMNQLMPGLPEYKRKEAWEDFRADWVHRRPAMAALIAHVEATTKDATT